MAEKEPSVESYALTVLKMKVAFLRMSVVVVDAAYSAVVAVVAVVKLGVVRSSGTAR